MSAFADLSATEIRRRVAAGDVSCEEVTRALLDRVATVEPRVNALLLPLPDVSISPLPPPPSGEIIAGLLTQTPGLCRLPLPCTNGRLPHL